MNDSILKATLVGALAVPMWASLGPLTALSGPIPTFQLMAFSFFVAFVAGRLITFVRGSCLADQMRQPPVAWLVGVGGLFAYHAFYFLALKSANPVEANLINYLWPLFIVLFAALLPGEHFSVRHMAGAAIGLAGTVLVVSGGGGVALSASGWGYAYALGAAVTWASYSLLSRRLAHISSEAVIPFLGVAAILSLLVHLGFEATLWPTSTAGWAYLVAMGLFPLGAAFFVWDIGCKQGDIRLLGTLAYATPLLSTMALLALGFGEPGWHLFFGAVLIVLAAWVARRGMANP